MRPADLHRLLSPRVVGGALSLQLVLAAGAVAGPWAVPPVPPAPPAPAAAAPPAAAAAVAPAPAPRGPMHLSAPGLWDGPVPAQPLGLDGDGALEVPTSAEALGWWADGARPGEPGAAVVVGHVDLHGEPGVFGRLAKARPGMIVTVTDDRARPVPFRVVEVGRYAKSAFPTEVVYAPTADAELRLVTCGGRFDPRTGHYADNVVVRAELA